MPRFGSFDQRNYQTLPAREGYAQWAETYEETIKHDMDVWLLEELQSVDWKPCNGAPISAVEPVAARRGLEAKEWR